MIAALARLRALPAAERRLLAEAAAALAGAALAIALLPFRRVARFAGRERAAAMGDGQDSTRRRIAWAVGAAARRMPFRSKCFEQGLAAVWMLRRRGIPATLHYGVASDGDALKAHVWVTSEGRDVVGCNNKGDFREMIRFPAARLADRREAS